MADENKKKRRASWDDIFGDFDEEFEEMRRHMDAIMEQFMSGEVEPGHEQPMIYGFSMRMGQDGKPRIQEFGARVPSNAPMEEPVKEPLTDIIEDKGTVRVIVEMPGVDRDDIQLNVEDGELDIEVNRDDP